MQLSEWVPKDEILQSGVIFRFVEFLTREDFPLLQFQAAQTLEIMASGTSEYTRVVIDHGALPNFVKLIGSPRDNICDLALMALGNIANYSREWRDLVLEHGAMMPLLLQLNEHADVMMLRRGAWVLCNFCYPNESQFEQIKLSLPTLRRLIYSNDEEVLMRACTAFSYLSYGTNDNIQLVIEAGICQRLVELLLHPSPTVLIRTLETVVNIGTGDYAQIQCIIDNGALPRLLSLLAHNHEESNSNITTENRDKIQLLAAFALAKIASGTSENIRVLIDHGAVPIFVKLLGSPSEDVREKAVLALGYIAENSPKYRDLVLEHGALMPLLHQLNEDVNLSMQINTTWTIRKFCECKPQPQFEQIKPALPALQRLIYSHDENVLSNACWCLYELFDGTNDKIHDVIDLGVCQRLVELLIHPSPIVLKSALYTIGKIVRGNDVPTQCIIDHGALPCLLSLLTHNHENSIKEYACWTISTITGGNRYLTQAVIEAGLIAPLLNLLKTAEFDIKKWAALAISNVTFDVTNEQIKFLVSEGCIKPLCDLLVCPNPKIVNACLNGLINILEVGKVEKNQRNTGDVNNFAQMIEEAEGLEKIENLQSHDNDEIREIAVQILKTYWLDKEALQIKLSLPTLQRLIYSNDEEVLRHACTAFSYLSNGTNDNIQLVIEAGICQRLVELLLHPSPTVLIPTLQTVANIGTGDYVQTQCIIDNGALPRLLSLLAHNHEESNSNITTENRDKIQILAVAALKNIASGTSENIKVLTDHGAVPIFVKLLGSPSEDVRQQAVLALGYIAKDSPKCRDLVLGHGGLMPLLHQLNEDAHLSMQTNATWTLVNICGRESQPQFEQIKPALPALQRLIHANDETVLGNACWALSYLSGGTNDKIQAVIDLGVCQRLVELLLHPSPNVLIPVMQIVINVAAGDDVRTQCIIDHGALACLLNLLTHNNHQENIKEYACWTIAYITAMNKDRIQALIEAGLIAPLLNLLQTAQLDVKKSAAWAILNVTCGGTREQIKFLVSEGCIKSLCDLLVCPDPNIVTVCLEGLENILKVGGVEKNQGNFSDVNNFAQMIDEAQGLEKIKNLQSHDNDEIRERVVLIIETYWLDKEDGEGNQA